MAIKIVKTKLKTKKCIAERVKITGTGKVLRRKGGKSHLNAHKSSARKRSLRKQIVCDKTHQKLLKLALPYAF